MFVDLNELKGVLIDVSPFPDDFVSWDKLSKKVRLLFLDVPEDQIGELLEKCPNCKIYCDSVLFDSYIDKNRLAQILLDNDLFSDNVVFVSNNQNNLDLLMQYPISTIAFLNGDSWTDDRLSNIPDAMVSSVSELAEIDDIKGYGYYAELESTIFDFGKKLQRCHPKIINKTLEVDGREYSLVIGGRYFKANDARSFTHQLSKRILLNKQSWGRQDDVFGQILFRLIDAWINIKIQPVDIVTRIPPRPSETDDKFDGILQMIEQKNPKYSNGKGALRCVRDYPKQKGLYAEQRAENIKGAFEADDCVEGKHVVLLDDVVSTGATSREAINALYEAGAKHVTFLVLATNQFDNPFRRRDRVPLKCECGAEYLLKIKPENGGFYGCPNYDTHSTTLLSYMEGRRKYNEINRIQVEDEEEDTFFF